MKRLMRNLEDLFVNITFAEEREFIALRQALKRASQKLEDTQTAIAFAEAGEFETAASYVTKNSQRPKNRRSCPTTRKPARLCTGRA